MTTPLQNVSASAPYGAENPRVAAERIRATIHSPVRTEAEANGVNAEQISQAMAGNESFSAQSISSYLAAQGDTPTATAQTTATPLDTAAAAATLNGPGNPELSDADIEAYISQPGRTPEQILAGALANGVNATQIARAMAGHPEFSLDSITAYLQSQGIAPTTEPPADPLDFRAETLFGAGNPAISAQQIQDFVNQPGVTSEQILAAAIDHGVSAEQLASALPERPEFSLANITNYIASQGIATKRDPSRYVNLQNSLLYGAGNAAISDEQIQAYINAPDRTEDQIINAALANGVSLAQIAKAMDGNPAFTLANLNDAVGFKQDFSSLEVLMLKQDQLLKALDAAPSAAASQQAMDALRANLAQLEPQLEAARTKVDARIAAGQAQDAVAAQAENDAAELKAQFDPLQLEKLHAQAKIDEQQAKVDAAQIEVNQAQAALDAANQAMANANGIHKKKRRHRAQGEAQYAIDAAKTALAAAQQKVAALQPGLAQAQADAAPAFAAAQAMQARWEAAQQIADSERAKSNVLLGAAQRAVQLEVALKQALTNDELQLVERGQNKAAQLQKQIDAGELSGSARADALKSIALDTAEAAELTQKIDAQATQDRLRESELRQAAVPAQTQATGAALIAQNLLGDAAKLNDAQTQVGTELASAKADLEAAGQRLIDAKIAFAQADFAVDWDQAKKDPTKSAKAVAIDQPKLDAATAELDAAQTAFDALQAKVSSLQHLSSSVGAATLDAAYAAGSAVQRANTAASQANAAEGWVQIAQARYESSDQLLAASQYGLIKSTQGLGLVQQSAAAQGDALAADASANQAWAKQYTQLVSDARGAAQATRAEQIKQNDLAIQAGGAQILSVFLKDKVAHASEVYAQAQAALSVQQDDFQKAAAHAGELAPAADQARQELADADLNAAFAFAVSRSTLSPEQLSAAQADKAGFLQTWQNAEMAKRTDARKQNHLLDDLAQYQKNDPACQAARQHALDTGHALEQASQAAIDAGDVVQASLIVTGLLGQSVLDDQAQLGEANTAAADLSAQVGNHALVLGQSAQNEAATLNTFSQGLSAVPPGVAGAAAYAPQVDSAKLTAELVGQVAAQMPQSSADWLKAADAWKAQAATVASALEALKTQITTEQTARTELGQKIQTSYAEQVQVHGYAAAVLKSYADRDDHIKELHEDRKLFDDAHKRYKKSQMMKMILKIGIAVIISGLAMWAGPLLGAMLMGVSQLGTVGTAVAVGVGAAAGSAISQGISIGAKLQDKFSLTEVALSGLSAGITVGALGSVAGQALTRGVVGGMVRVGLVEALVEGAVPTLAQNIAKNVAFGVTGGAINTGVQGAMTAVGLQQKMDWGQVAAVGLAMGLTSATQGFADSFKVGTGPSLRNGFVDSVQGTFAGAVAAGATTPIGGNTPAWLRLAGAAQFSPGASGVHMGVPEGHNVATNPHFVEPHPFAPTAPGSKLSLHLPNSTPLQPKELNLASAIGDAFHYVGTGAQKGVSTIVGTTTDAITSVRDAVTPGGSVFKAVSGVPAAATGVLKNVELPGTITNSTVVTAGGKVVKGVVGHVVKTGGAAIDWVGNAAGAVKTAGNSLVDSTRLGLGFNGAPAVRNTFSNSPPDPHTGFKIPELLTNGLNSGLALAQDAVSGVKNTVSVWVDAITPPAGSNTNAPTTEGRTQFVRTEGGTLSLGSDAPFEGLSSQGSSGAFGSLGSLNGNNVRSIDPLTGLAAAGGVKVAFNGNGEIIEPASRNRSSSGIDGDQRLAVPEVAPIRLAGTPKNDPKDALVQLRDADELLARAVEPLTRDQLLGSLAHGTVDFPAAAKITKETIPVDDLPFVARDRELRRRLEGMSPNMLKAKTQELTVPDIYPNVRIPVSEFVGGKEIANNPAFLNEVLTQLDTTQEGKYILQAANRLPYQVNVYAVEGEINQHPLLKDRSDGTGGATRVPYLATGQFLPEILRKLSLSGEKVTRNVYIRLPKGWVAGQNDIEIPGMNKALVTARHEFDHVSQSKIPTRHEHFSEELGVLMRDDQFARQRNDEGNDIGFTGMLHLRGQGGLDFNERIVPQRWNQLGIEDYQQFSAWQKLGLVSFDVGGGNQTLLHALQTFDQRWNQAGNLVGINDPTNSYNSVTRAGTIRTGVEDAAKAYELNTKWLGDENLARVKFAKDRKELADDVLKLFDAGVVKVDRQELMARTMEALKAEVESGRYSPNDVRELVRGLDLPSPLRLFIDKLVAGPATQMREGEAMEQIDGSLSSPSWLVSEGAGTNSSATKMDGVSDKLNQMRGDGPAYWLANEAAGSMTSLERIQVAGVGATAGLLARAPVMPVSTAALVGELGTAGIIAKWFKTLSSITPAGFAATGILPTTIDPEGTSYISRANGSKDGDGAALFDPYDGNFDDSVTGQSRINPESLLGADRVTPHALLAPPRRPAGVTETYPMADDNSKPTVLGGAALPQILSGSATEGSRILPMDGDLGVHGGNTRLPESNSTDGGFAALPQTGPQILLSGNTHSDPQRTFGPRDIEVVDQVADALEFDVPLENRRDWNNFALGDLAGAKNIETPFMKKDSRGMLYPGGNAPTSVSDLNVLVEQHGIIPGTKGVQIGAGFDVGGIQYNDLLKLSNKLGREAGLPDGVGVGIALVSDHVSDGKAIWYVYSGTPFGILVKDMPPTARIAAVVEPQNAFSDLSLGLAMVEKRFGTPNIGESSGATALRKSLEHRAAAELGSDAGLFEKIIFKEGNIKPYVVISGKNYPGVPQVAFHGLFHPGVTSARTHYRVNQSPEARITLATSGALKIARLDGLKGDSNIEAIVSAVRSTSANQDAGLVQYQVILSHLSAAEQAGLNEKLSNFLRKPGSNALAVRKQVDYELNGGADRQGWMVTWIENITDMPRHIGGKGQASLQEFQQDFLPGEFTFSRDDFNKQDIYRFVGSVEHTKFEKYQQRASTAYEEFEATYIEQDKNLHLGPYSSYAAVEAATDVLQGREGLYEALLRRLDNDKKPVDAVSVIISSRDPEYGIMNDIVKSKIESLGLQARDVDLFSFGGRHEIDGLTQAVDETSWAEKLKELGFPNVSITMDSDGDGGIFFHVQFEK